MSIYSPTELHETVRVSAEALGSVEFVVGGTNKRLREMWCAARFGMGYETHLDLCSIEIEDQDEQREYDFHLLSAGRRIPFQIAEVLEPDRRRGDEYRGLSEQELGEVLNRRPWHSIEYAAHVTRQLLAKKARHYGDGSSIHMLLYFNLNVASIPWPALAAATEPEARHFASVWLLSQHLFCCLQTGALWPGLTGWRSIESEA